MSERAKMKDWDSKKSTLWCVGENRVKGRGLAEGNNLDKKRIKELGVEINKECKKVCINEKFVCNVRMRGRYCREKKEGESLEIHMNIDGYQGIRSHSGQAWQLLTELFTSSHPSHEFIRRRFNPSIEFA